MHVASITRISPALKLFTLEQFLIPILLLPLTRLFLGAVYTRGHIQKFPDWPPGTRTANGTALCH